MKLPHLDLGSLSTAYQSGDWTPVSLVQELYEKIANLEPSHIWITLLKLDDLLVYARKIEERGMESQPLYGVPFAIKDNIDLQGIATTAACPGYSYVPKESAFVVQQLIDAGAIPLGKTNLDQFATGLVGVRSPYGVPRNAYDPDYIPGGSSSGSAVAVAKGLASFSLGTDTAGSGRIPASFNNLIGHKPTRGIISCTGVVPACRTLDSVSIFTLNASDAGKVLDIAAQYDAKDAYCRPTEVLAKASRLGSSFSFGVPQPAQLKFFGNEDAEDLYHQAVERLVGLGGEKLEIDFSPFLEAALLLYEGPWVSERYVAIEDIILNRPEILYPVTRKIIEGGAAPLASDAFKAEYRLRQLKRSADQQMAGVDFIVTPTAGTIYTKKEVADNPIELNSNLGYYTNFMNLLDYAATALPAGFMNNGLPFGVTVFGPAHHDKQLLDLAARFAGEATAEQEAPDGWTPLVVCGAHMEALALNEQLITRSARLWKKTRTAPIYEFFALPAVGDHIPPRPGLQRVAKGGVAVQVEVWHIPTSSLGDFVAQIPAPLGIGKIEMEDGSLYPGFICEGVAIDDSAISISHLADWRLYLAEG